MSEHLPQCILVGVTVCSLRETLADYFPVTVCVCDHRPFVAEAVARRALTRFDLSVESVDWIGQLDAGFSLAQPEINRVRRLAAVQPCAIALEDLSFELRPSELIENRRDGVAIGLEACNAFC